MLALLFGLAVLTSLATTAAIGLGVLPASPPVMGVVFGAHAIFGLFFFRGYTGYRALHRLIEEGRGELFDLGIRHRIATNRTRGFRDHYRLRRIEGLALTGLSLEALAAAEDHRRHVDAGPHGQLSALVAQAAANLQLGQLWWARRALSQADVIDGAQGHAGLAAVRGRLSHLEGDPTAARESLARLTGAGEFPLKRVVRARNLFWLGEAMGAGGDAQGAANAFGRAVRAAPRSYYGRSAARRLRQTPVR